MVRGIRGFGGVPWRRLFGYLRPHWGRSPSPWWAWSSAGLSLLVPLVVAGLVGAVVAGGDPAGLDRLIAALVVLFLAQSLGGLRPGVPAGRGRRAHRGPAARAAVRAARDALARLPRRRRVGELVSRLSSDVTLVRTMLTQTTTSLLSSVIGLVGSVIILFTLSPTLLLVVLLLAPALIAVAIVFGRPLQRVSTQVQDAIARSTPPPRRRSAASASSRATCARSGRSSATTRTCARRRGDGLAAGAVARGVRRR